MEKCNEERKFNYCTILNFQSTMEALFYMSLCVKSSNSSAWTMLCIHIWNTHKCGVFFISDQTNFHKIYTTLHSRYSDIITCVLYYLVRQQCLCFIIRSIQTWQVVSNYSLNEKNVYIFVSSDKASPIVLSTTYITKYILVQKRSY